jgi:hypothetical protein
MDEAGLGEGSEKKSESSERQDKGERLEKFKLHFYFI